MTYPPHDRRTLIINDCPVSAWRRGDRQARSWTATVRTCPCCDASGCRVRVHFMNDKVQTNADHSAVTSRLAAMELEALRIRLGALELDTRLLREVVMGHEDNES